MLGFAPRDGPRGANSLGRAFRHRLRNSVRSANKSRRPPPKTRAAAKVFQPSRGGEKENQCLEQGVERLAMETGVVRFI